MDHLGDLRIFVAVVESQGFSAASRHLGVPIPTVCRRIANLESKLGVQLLVRSTRKTIATECGRRYYEDVRRILEDIHSAERLAIGEYQQVTGVLTLTAPSLFMHRFVLPIVNDFMRLHENIEVRLISTNHVLDMLNDHIDLGVKIAPLASDAVMMDQVGTMRQIVCASPEYLTEKGYPSSPEDIYEHETITFSRSCDQVLWPFCMQDGKRVDIQVKSKLVVNSAESAIESALRSAGLSQVYQYQVAPQIKSGEMEVVLEDFEMPAVPVCLTIPKGQNSPQKVKAFIDFAKPRLEQQLEKLALMSRRCVNSVTIP